MRAAAPRWLAGIVLTLGGVLTAGCDGYFVVIAVAPSSQVIVVDPTQKGGSIGGPKKDTATVPGTTAATVHDDSSAASDQPSTPKD